MLPKYGVYKMRKKKQYKTIILSQEVYDRIQYDKKHFQEVIGGGKWSNNDTLREYISILNGLKDD